MKKYLSILLLLISSIGWGQDTANRQFASIDGKYKGTISWDELLNSKIIEPHGYPDYSIKEFCLKIMPGIKNADDTIKKDRNFTVNGSAVILYDIAPYLYGDNDIFCSESEKITDEMWACFKRRRGEDKLRILISNILIVNKKMKKEDSKISYYIYNEVLLNRIDSFKICTFAYRYATKFKNY